MQKYSKTEKEARLETALLRVLL